MNYLRMILFFALLGVAQAAENEPVRDIRIEGLDGTHEYVVRRELRFRVGEPISPEVLQESLQRLRNLQIFSHVAGELQPAADGVAVLIRVEERWTTLPILRAVSGGGSVSYIVGLFDINSFGRYLELGGQYENLNGNHSGVVWFRDPRFLDQFLRVGGDAWLQMRNRDLYNQSGQREGAFTLERKRLHLFADRELHRYFTLGLGVDLHWDDLSEGELSADRLALNAANGFTFNSELDNYFLQLYTQLGRLNYDVYKIDGYQSLIEYDQTAEAWGADATFFRVLATNTAFWRLPWDANLGLQLRLGATDTAAEQYLFYLGGFDSIRGFSDGKFRGGAFWQTNVEYRIPSYQGRWLVLQHVVFTDAAQVDDDLQALSEFNNELFASLGTGIRLISPKIYRFNLRVDVAVPLNLDEGPSVSFATQQFF